MTIDPVKAVLDSMRDAQPAEGMEQRILAAVRTQERAPSPRFPAGLFWVPALAVLAVIAVASLVVLRQHAAHRGTMAKLPVAVRSMPAVPVEMPVRFAETVRTAPSHVARTQTLSRPVEEMQDASFPAPPLPLTEQEGLLIRFVHKNDPVQLASLADDARSVQLERDKASVKAFFAPSYDPPAPDAVQQDHAVPTPIPAAIGDTP